MDKLKAVLRSRKFYAGVVLVLSACGLSTGAVTIDALSSVLCGLAGGCTP